MFKRVGWVLLSLAAVTVGGVLMSQADVAWGESGDHGIFCVMDVVVDSENQTGQPIGSEVYHKEFVLQEGVTLFEDDFSTRTRFKFFTATLHRNNGENTVTINWYADVTVFNSVDFNTSVTLADGNKRGKVTGDDTVYTSNGSTTTNFSLSCVEN